MIDSKTTVCCIVGDPVEHSMSPAMHNAGYAAQGLNWAYVAFRVTDVEAAVAGVRALGVRGVSVTIPHKLAVIPFLDELDEVAEMIGSVNTIVNDGGRLTGMNTDGAGAVKSLEDAGVTLEGSRVLMLGSGGAARAIACTLAARCGIARLSILGEIEDEMRSLAEDVSAKTGVPATHGKIARPALETAIEQADLVIHATPVGMHPNEGEAVVPAELWVSGLNVMDIVYNPRQTRLSREAAEAGCKTIQGLDMLFNQGVLQYEAWTGRKAPEDVMRQALERGLAGK